MSCPILEPAVRFRDGQPGNVLVCEALGSPRRPNRRRAMGLALNCGRITGQPEVIPAEPILQLLPGCRIFGTDPQVTIWIPSG
jgi:hypothetical protein